MKTFAPAALAALRDGTAIEVGAVKIARDPDPVLVWGGYGDVVLGGETYKGVGHNGLVRVSGASIGGAAQASLLELSGVDADTGAALLAALVPLRGAPAVLWRLIYNGTGSTQLDAQVFERGRVDRVVLTDTPGGTSALQVYIENAARGLGRSGARTRSDADQRTTVAVDGGLRKVAFAGDIVLNWGGKPAASAAAALPNTATPGRSAGGGAPGGLDVHDSQRFSG